MSEQRRFPHYVPVFKLSLKNCSTNFNWKLRQRRLKIRARVVRVPTRIFCGSVSASVRSPDTKKGAGRVAETIPMHQVPSRGVVDGKWYPGDMANCHELFQIRNKQSFMVSFPYNVYIVQNAIR